MDGRHTMTRSSCFQIGFLVSDWGSDDLAYEAAREAFVGFYNELGEPLTSTVQVRQHESLWTRTLSLVHLSLPDKKDEGWAVAFAYPDKNVLACISPKGMSGVFTPTASRAS